VGVAALALALGLLGSGCASSEAHSFATQHFVSRPDLRPSPVEVLRPAHGTAPGLIFVSPERGVDQAGPLILDDHGQVVWFHPVSAHRVTSFQVQRYRGRPVLTWWSSEEAKGSGHNGVYVIADDHYRIIATLTAAHGLAADLHEFVLTPRGTAIVTAYKKLPYDLSAVGGSDHGSIWEGIVQELDVATGRLLFEWHSIDHVGVAESYETLPKDSEKTYDYFHINAVDLLPNGDMLVSARNTHAVYDIRRSDGAVRWRLGGKRSDFSFGHGARFAWQHDARLHGDGTLTVFDNGAESGHRDRPSRAILLRLDRKQRRAVLVRSYTRRQRMQATSEGNGQLLPDGHVLVGWGSLPFVTEFSRDGRVLLDLRIGAFGVRSYRSFRFPWTGHPVTKPVVAARRGRHAVTVYASWNGSTEVAGWRVLAGSDRQHLSEAAEVRKAGFETAIRLPSRPHVVRVAALDARGRVLRYSDVVNPS
jgi:Arylsulfotransferase (ASST)